MIKRSSSQETVAIARVLLRELLAEGVRAETAPMASAEGLQKIARDGGFSRVLVDRSGPLDGISRFILRDANESWRLTLPETRTLIEKADLYIKSIKALYEFATEECKIPVDKLPAKEYVYLLKLQLLQNCLMLVNTILVERTLDKYNLWDRLKREDRRALTPLFHTHINPYGDFVSGS